MCSPFWVQKCLLFLRSLANIAYILKALQKSFYLNFRGKYEKSLIILDFILSALPDINWILKSLTGQGKNNAYQFIQRKWQFITKATCDMN